MLSLKEKSSYSTFVKVNEPQNQHSVTVSPQVPAKVVNLLKNLQKKKLNMTLLLHLSSSVHLLTQRRLVQEVQLCVEGLDLGVFLLDDADDKVQQRLLSVSRFGVQQLERQKTKTSAKMRLKIL